MANVSLFMPLVLVIIIGGRLLQRLQYPTEINYIRILQSGPYHAGDVIDVEFTVKRRRTCELQIERIFENEDDHREFRTGAIRQLILKDNPLIVRNEEYRVTIPAELKPGKYELFSRFRYYCVAIDNFLPWIRKTPSIILEVVS